jgi:hypothetical protein
MEKYRPQFLGKFNFLTLQSTYSIFPWQLWTTPCPVQKLQKHQPFEEIHSKYLNRLSDYLFMLSRWITIDKKAIEMPWKPKM